MLTGVAVFPVVPVLLIGLGKERATRHAPPITGGHGRIRKGGNHAPIIRAVLHDARHRPGDTVNGEPTCQNGTTHTGVLFGDSRAGGGRIGTGHVKPRVEGLAIGADGSLALVQS